MREEDTRTRTLRSSPTGVGRIRGCLMCIICMLVLFQVWELIHSNTATAAGTPGSTTSTEKNPPLLPLLLQGNTSVPNKVLDSSPDKQEPPSFSSEATTSCTESSPAYPLHITHFPHTRNVSKFMQPVSLQSSNNGTASVLSSSSSSTVMAICRFQHDLPFAHHFPHSMQQLYRCWSWWRYQQKLQAQQNNNAHVQFVLECNVTKFAPPQKNTFVSGFLTLLQNTSNVLITAHAKDAAITTERNRSSIIMKVQAKLNDGGLYDYAMTSSHDAQALRQAVVQHSMFAHGDGTTTNHSPGETNDTTQQEADVEVVCPDIPRITILNRQHKRRILNVEQLHNHLQTTTLGHVATTHFETATFRQQVSTMMQTDILLSPHGAQLTSVPFLPPCATILEIFPTGYYAPYFFGTLAAVSGVAAHGVVYLGINQTTEVAQGSHTMAARRQTRRRNLCIPVHNVTQAVQTLLGQWKECCQQRSNNSKRPL